MQLSFTNQYLNLLFLLNGVIVLLFIYTKKKRKKRAITFGNYETLQKIAGKNFLKTSNVLVITRVLALTTLIIGISSPVLVQEVSSSESDFVIALDSSASMFTSDIDPTRFQAAKEVSGSFIEEAQGETRIGLVAYSGDIEKIVEPTEDRPSVAAELETVEMGETGGTNLAQAIRSSTSALIGNNRPGNIILVTDGENTVNQSLNSSITYASSHKTEVHAIGIGSSNSTQNYQVIGGENASEAVFPNLNRGQLERIANTTGGEARFVSNRTGLREAFLDIGQQRKETDLSNYFILFSAALLVFEMLFRSTRFEVLP